MPAGSNLPSSKFLDSAKGAIQPGKGLPPVHLWNPPLCGDLDMRIAKDGVWLYQGSAINRSSLVRLFSTILRRDEDGCFYLVTPVEKWRIEVESAPFVAIAVEKNEQEGEPTLNFVTNVGDTVTASSEHPIRVEINPDSDEPSPFIHIRDGLEAKISRSVFYQLANMAHEKDLNGQSIFGVESAGQFFSLS
ncbi:MAG: DUF1285 domain-containing protein [Pseudomonadales bacterium]|nr:DUF1285 domain-containing protein [Pseudomonadales bacterium]